MRIAFDEQLTLRVPASLRQILEEQAARRGQKLTDYVRMTLHERAQQQLQELGPVAVNFVRRTEDPGAKQA